MQLNGCASTEEIPIINLNPEKIKSLEDLVREMKQAAGKRTPKDVDLNAIYKTLADAFVEYAQEAISLGAKIPDEIVKRLPLKRKVVVPALMIFPLWGVQFVIPITVFFNAILGSLSVMLLFIAASIRETMRKTKGSTLNDYQIL
jgi:hypothetical protein